MKYITIILKHIVIALSILTIVFSDAQANALTIENSEAELFAKYLDSVPIIKMPKNRDELTSLFDSATIIPSQIYQLIFQSIYLQIGQPYQLLGARILGKVIYNHYEFMLIQDFACNSEVYYIFSINPIELYPRGLILFQDGPMDMFTFLYNDGVILSKSSPINNNGEYFIDYKISRYKLNANFDEISSHIVHINHEEGQDQYTTFKKYFWDDNQ